VNQRTLARKGLVGTAVCLLWLTGSAVSAQTVSWTIDTTTKGDWRTAPNGGYGTCGYLIPHPDQRIRIPELTVGPDFESQAPGQYTYNDPTNARCGGAASIGDPGCSINHCSGGQLFSTNVLDWRVNTTHGNTGLFNAFAYHLCEPADGSCPVPAGTAPGIDTQQWFARAGASQWNPCTNTFYNGTWDSDLASNDPLNVELDSFPGGDARIAYYFVDGDSICRTQSWTLYIDNVSKATGTITDFAQGKYLVFDVAGLSTASTHNVRLELSRVADACSGTPGSTYISGFNSHVSSVFIDGTTVCAPPPPDNPGTGTPGYWINHPEAWPVDSITIGGVTYTKAQAIALMALPVKKDKTLTMFPALVSAKLNVIIGNDSSCISSVIASADAWMAEYPVSSGVLGSSPEWRVGDPLYQQLDWYNNGLLCAPHRD